MNLDVVKNLPLYQKGLALGLIVALTIAMASWLVFLPKNNRIAALKTDIAKIESEIGTNRARADKLEILKKENAHLERLLMEKKQQLPPQAEIESLLKQISDLGLRAGLNFKLWRPSAKKENPNGLYSEIPVDVEIEGGYHTIATFFDSVADLPRIVNITGIRMSNPRLDRGRVLMQTSFVATAFAAASPKPAETGEP